MKQETMSSRQRVINAVKHLPVDRVPIDLGVHFSTGISAFAYYNLRKYLGLDVENVEMIDCIQNLARVDEDVIKRFHVDTMLLNPSWPKSKVWNPRDDFKFKVPGIFDPQLQSDGSYKVSYKGETLYMPKGGFFFDGGWPDYYDYFDENERLNAFAKRAQMIYEETDKYTMFMGFNGFFDGLDFACDMLTDPEDCISINEERLKKQIELFDKINKKMGKYINCIEVNSDLGTQDGLMCTPDSYHEVVFPFLKKFCDHVHNNSDIHIFMHSCGAIFDLLDQISEAGIDIINPVQISARKMDPTELKKQFGDKLCFWGGGCNTQSILNHGSPETVKKHVEENMKIFKEGSGFVFNQVHNIMGDVAPENIVSLFDTAYKNSFYE